MNGYEPKELVAKSRYRNYFPTLPADVREDVYERMDELLVEESQWCDKGNRAHLAQILTSIALYEVLQAHGANEEEAYKAVSENMWAFLDPSGIQKLARLPFFLPLMKKIVPLGFQARIWNWLALHVGLRRPIRRVSL